MRLHSYGSLVRVDYSVANIDDGLLESRLSYVFLWALPLLVDGWLQVVCLVVIHNELDLHIPIFPVHEVFSSDWAYSL